MVSGNAQRRLVATLAVVVLTVTACGSSKSSSTASNGKPANGGALVDLQNFAAGDPDHIDPALANDTQSSQIPALLFEGLTQTAADGTLNNAVADSAKPNGDASVWTFKLRSGVTFSNGDPVTPSDFKFAWERVINPALASKNADKFSIIKGSGADATTLSGVVADDTANTLTVTLNYPFRDFPALVSLPAFSPVPKRVVSALPDQSGWEKGVMIGDGPFDLAEAWTPGKSIKLIRNDGYFGGVAKHKAYLDSIEFRVSASVDSAFTDFDSGKGQVGRIPPGQFAASKSKYGNDVVNTPTLGTEYWGFNLNDPSVGGPDNVKLRQAIALAINKTDINTKVFDGSRQVATSWAPPGVPGYKASGDSPDRNVARAKELLTQFGKPLPAIKISFNAGAGHDDKAAIIQQNLAEIGIVATPDPLDNQAYRKAVGTGQLQFFRAAWSADFVSYDNFIYPQFDSDSIGGDNVFGYNNNALDALVKRARSEQDSSTRNDLYRQAEKAMLADQVVVPIDWTTAGLVKAPSVTNFSVKPLGYVDYAEVWVKS